MNDMNELLNDLKRIGLQSSLIENADMREFTSFKAGGSADLLVVPYNEDELKIVLQRFAQCKLPFVVMGKGTNLLIRDGGYRGAIICLGTSFAEIQVDGTIVKAGAGASLSAVARAALENSLTGIEFASGIPGSLGGGVLMNAGAYDGEMKDVVLEVRVLSQDGGQTRRVTNKEMGYGYRLSNLMDTKEIVLSASLNLAIGDREKISSKMKEFNESRNLKQPMELPSAGSFFKRPKGYYAGKLIQDAGLKGLTVGGAQVSTKHSGFIVNIGNATATDIITLMHLVQATVLDQFGVMIEPEVRIIGEEI
jgi:UDP-N-acetylmuramate dehydrogenase